MESVYMVYLKNIRGEYEPHGIGTFREVIRAGLFHGNVVRLEPLTSKNRSKNNV